MKKFNEFNMMFEQVEEDNLYQSLIDYINEMMRVEHRSQEIREFYRHYRLKLPLLSDEERIKIEKYLDDNYKKMPIKKFPYERPNFWQV